MSNGDNGERPSSTRECITEIRETLIALRIGHGQIQGSLETLNTQVKGAHSRISEVKDCVNSLRVDLSTHISYSKGASSVWAKIKWPVRSGVAAVIATVLVTSWESLFQWAMEVIQ